MKFVANIVIFTTDKTITNLNYSYLGMGNKRLL